MRIVAAILDYLEMYQSSNDFSKPPYLETLLNMSKNIPENFMLLS